MSKPVVAAVIVILIEACVIFRLLHQNHVSLSISDAVAKELTQARASVETQESDIRTLRATNTELEQELSRATQALSLKMTSNLEISAPPAIKIELDPLGLTTNDVDLAGMFVVGTNTIGTLFVPIHGKVWEKLAKIHSRRLQPLVFGTLLGETNGYTALGRWEKNGTNVQGLALSFHSTAEAEAFANQMRAQATQ